MTGRDGKSYPATKQHKGPAGKPAVKSVAVELAHEAINALRRIPRDDPNRMNALGMIRNYLKTVTGE